jgi:hypothetical protein
MLHPDGIEVLLRPVGSQSQGEDAKYDELVLPPKADYQGRYLQCFIPHRDGGFEVVVEYLDLLDMHGASTMLVGIVLKLADATLETPAFVLCHAAEHAKKMPSENNVFATEGGIPMQWLMRNGGTNGEHYRHIRDESLNADVKTAQGQPKFALNDDEYAEDVRPGCVGISFQRGHAEWDDERYDGACRNILLDDID